MTKGTFWSRGLEQPVPSGDYFDTEVKRSVQGMVSAIGPLTIVILGAVFGVIALSIMLPLYDVIGNLEGKY